MTNNLGTMYQRFHMSIQSQSQITLRPQINNLARFQLYQGHLIRGHKRDLFIALLKKADRYLPFNGQNISARSLTQKDLRALKCKFLLQMCCKESRYNRKNKDAKTEHCCTLQAREVQEDLTFFKQTQKRNILYVVCLQSF